MLPWVREICWKRDRLPTPVFLGFPCGSAGKETTCNAGDLGLIPGLGRSPGEEKGYPLQYSGLENSKYCIVHGVTKSQTRLRDFHFSLHFQHIAWVFPGGTSSEESTCQCRRYRRLRFDPWGGKISLEMATHSSILAWKIPWAEEPGRLQSMRPQRARHN